MGHWPNKQGAIISMMFVPRREPLGPGFGPRLGANSVSGFAQWLAFRFLLPSSVRRSAPYMRTGASPSKARPEARAQNRIPSTLQALLLARFLIPIFRPFSTTLRENRVA